MTTAAEIPTEPLPPLVGLREITNLFGTEHLTVNQWRYRGQLPEPDLTVSKTPIWRLSRIEQWATQTGRKITNRKLLKELRR
jgi:hypothetical protein